MSKTYSYKIHIKIINNDKIIFDQIFDKLPISIGRDPNCDVALTNYDTVSAQHATIIPIGNQICIINNTASNGLIYNNESVDNLALEDETKVQINPLDIIIKKEVIIVSKEDVTLKIPSPTNEQNKAKVPNLMNSKQNIGTKNASVNKTNKINSNKKNKNLNLNNKNFHQNGAFIQRIETNKIALEGSLIWRGQVLDTKVFHKNDVLSLSPNPDNGFYIPNLKRTFSLAQFNGASTKCILPINSKGQVTDKNNHVSDLQSVLKTNYKKKSALLKINNDQSCIIKITNDIDLQLQHIEAPKLFSQIKFLIPEKLFKKTLKGSGVLHLIILLTALLLAPTQEVPKVKNLPPRIAKLLVPTKKKVEVKPEIKKPLKKEKIVKTKKKIKAKKKKIVKQKKRIYKPKKVVVRTNKRMKKINKMPFTVKTKTVSTRPNRGKITNKKNIKKVGALAALGALGKSKQISSKKPVAININKNAGGSPGKVRANSVIGAIKSKNGKLAAGGSGSLKTHGKGFGTGSGYGVQGIKGRAGGRGRDVAATVVGTPTLMKISDTEGLSQKEVMDVVKKHAGKISSCYERSLLSNPGLSGKIEYEWKIKPSGQVSWAKVKKSDIQNSSELNNCVIAVFKKMKFPKAKNGESTQPNIGLPFGRL